MGTRYYWDSYKKARKSAESWNWSGHETPLSGDWHQCGAEIGREPMLWDEKTNRYENCK